MIALSSAGEDLLLSQVFQTANTWPAVAFIALFTTVPGKDDGGVECAGTGYSRAAVGFTTSDWTGPTMGQISNSNVISFGTPGAADWDTILGFAFMMDAYSMNQLSAGIPFSSAKTPVAGTPVTFAPGTLVISSLEVA